MTIHYRQQIEGSPVVRFVAKAWVALMDDKQWDSTSVLVTGNLQCVYARDGNKVTGCLTFHVDAEQAVVNIAYVLPKYRGQGIYRQMHDAFVEQAKKQEAKELVNICYPSNTGIRETVRKLGYSVYSEHWIKRVI
jgi:ribosomal protein S18 acetylase RimI-like enzyme